MKKRNKVNRSKVPERFVLNLAKIDRYIDQFTAHFIEQIEKTYSKQ